MSAQPISTRSRGADAGRGLLSLVGVLVLVVGVPAALLTWVGSPLPAGVPSLSDITDALADSYIPDEFLVKALALVCWLVWIELVASLLVEAVAYVRGRKAGNVPLAGGLQRGAARLIAGVALLGAVTATKGLPTSGTAPAGLAPVAEPVIALSIDDGKSGGQVSGPRLSQPAPTPSPDLPSYEVQRRDTLWDIAERHLGDPFRWNEIFQINEGCLQSDGGCLRDPDVIHPGWRLQLPADASGLAPPASGPAKQAKPLDPGTSASTGGSPDGSPESLAIDGGMVLIDDDGSAGDLTIVTGDHQAPDGAMVLLPDDPASGGEPLVAAPDRDDELAGRPEHDR